jgi:hypothetical protein
VQVGDLVKKRSTGQLCLVADHAPAKFGNAWMKVFLNGKCSKWVNAYNYEALK